MAVQLKAPYSLQITEQNQIIAVSSPTCDGNIPFMRSEERRVGKEVHSYLCWSPARKMPDLVGCYPIESNGKWTEPTVQCIGPDCKQQMCVAYLLS